MAKRSLKFLGLFLVPYIFSCTSAPLTQLKETDGEGNQTAFLLSYRFVNSGSPENTKSCALVLRNFHASQKFQIPLEPSEKMIQVEAPAGTYEVEELVCGRNAHWKMRNFHALSVVAHPQKINYLGNFSFDVSYREKTHELALQKGDREKTRKVLSQYAQNHSQEWRERLVSAYNGKGWELKYLENETHYKRGTTRRFSGKSAQLKAYDFTECEKNEFWRNPVPLGELSYQVTYEHNQFVKLEKVADENSFSNEYIECVEEKLQALQPGYNGLVRYDVNL